jgi:hypothetical protein
MGSYNLFYAEDSNLLFGKINAALFANKGIYTCRKPKNTFTFRQEKAQQIITQKHVINASEMQQCTDILEQK